MSAKVAFDTGWIPGPFLNTLCRERIMSQPVTRQDAEAAFGIDKNTRVFISNHNPLCVIQERLTRNHFNYQPD